MSETIDTHALNDWHLAAQGANIGEKITTYLGLRLGLLEANPVLNLGILHFGVVSLIIGAIVTSIVLSYLVWRGGVLALKIITTLLLIVFGWNLFLLLVRVYG